MRLEDSTDELLFLDTSWLCHNYNHWNENKDMNRWLKGLSEISSIRAKKGLKTTRVFFWNPSEIKTHDTIYEIMDTISNHLTNGTNVYLSEPTEIIHPLDFQLFSKSEGMMATDFKNLNIQQLDKSSDIAIAEELYNLIQKNIGNSKTMKFKLNQNMIDVKYEIEKHCGLVK
jgi:hypothetical protein